ncbi:MAG TPA: DedA family protein [Stellaceae bacterium]|jgi:membrane protein DedA with SNARE-associated domain|nr:DedA family protein [Stellaceae bacterium]
MLESFLGEAQRYVNDYGYTAVFLGVFLESFGLPTPGESLMIAGALLASGGHLNIYWILLLCWIATTAGGNIGYVIGKKGGRPLILRYGPRVRITHRQIEQVEDFFARHGGAVVLFARFVVVLRQLNGIVAGTMGMNPWRFSIYNTAGAALWVGFWAGLTYYLGRRFHGIVAWVSSLEPIVVIVAVAAIAAGLAYLWRHQRQRRKRKRATRKA